MVSLSPLAVFWPLQVFDVQLSPWLTEYTPWVNFSWVWSLLFLIAISVLFRHYDYYWDVYVHGYSFWTTDIGFLKLCNFGFAIAHPWDVAVPGPFCRILDWMSYHRTPSCQICILNEDILYFKVLDSVHTYAFTYIVTSRNISTPYFSFALFVKYPCTDFL